MGDGKMLFAPTRTAGLVLPSYGPVFGMGDAKVHLTVEAAVTPDTGENLRVDLLVAEDALVAQGQPLIRLRTAPSVVMVAPMAGRVARIDLHPGQRLSQLVLFLENGAGRHVFDTVGAKTDARALLQACGLWRAFRSRPFGRMPTENETPAAIFIMGIDSKPGAPPPWQAIAGQEEDFGRGLGALAQLSTAKLFMCEPDNHPCPVQVPAAVNRLQTRPIHPQGLAGFQIHHHFPARATAPVWDIHAEDVAGIGAFLETGCVPETRLVSITGDALRENSLVRCQTGANLRGLSQHLVRPGPHDVLSGAMLDGVPAHWLAPRDRQVTLHTRAAKPTGQHWFTAALERAARHAPIIPTAALDQAFGGALPAAALVRALATGDAESFTQLGGLSLLEEDVALADYATGARPRLATQLRALLTQIEVTEGVP
jgi:Na+-transporting NADH:ubiquinone oxidoreductase subunit A